MASGNTQYVLWRRDENGQILLMCRFHSNSQEQRVCARYQRQKKPRYHYWVTTLAPHGPH